MYQKLQTIKRNHIHVHVNKYKYYRIKIFSNTYKLKVF